jgi:DNA-binding PucR family transcriptional regulator
VPANLVRTMITGTPTIISKTLRPPDLTTIQDTLNIMQTEAKDRTEETAKAMATVRVELRYNAADIKQSITIGEETRAAVEEATEKGSKVVGVVKELKDKAPSVRAAPIVFRNQGDSSRFSHLVKHKLLFRKGVGSNPTLLNISFCPCQVSACCHKEPNVSFAMPS